MGQPVGCNSQRFKPEDSFSESKDITTFETLYSWLDAEPAGQDPSWDPGAIFAPPWREWTRPVERNFATWSLGSTGARWLFSDELRLSAGLGIGGEVLDGEPNAPLTADLAFEVLKLPITHWRTCPFCSKEEWMYSENDRLVTTPCEPVHLAPRIRTDALPRIDALQREFALVSSEVPFSGRRIFSWEFRGILQGMPPLSEPVTRGLEAHRGAITRPSFDGTALGPGQQS